MTKPQIITRFAPSPTGYLHIGGGFIALFNYLYARANHGKFLLRVEDTDKSRHVEGAVDAILRSLKWLGLEWDGEVVLQSEREARHAEVARELVAKGKAYYCYETAEELAAKREAAKAEGKIYKYDRKWRDADLSSALKDIKPSIRIKAPLTGETIVHDKVQGNVVVKNSELDDMVILRSDGTPTYMLAVVVDDHDMGVTHIIRGDDHLNNTPRQMVIYEAMGWNIPVFAHVPMIHGPDGAKLSKRHGALGVEEYEKMGFLPETMRNYLLRLGWSHGNDEIISDKQALEWFNLENIGRAPSRLDFDKMKNLNGHYIRAADDKRLVDLILPILGKNAPKDILLKAMPSLKERAKTIPELAESAKFYIARPAVSDADKKKLEEGKGNIAPILDILKNTAEWQGKNLEAEVKNFMAGKGFKPGQILPVLRILLTGSGSSPGSIFEIMEILGREEALKRLEAA